VVRGVSGLVISLVMLAIVIPVGVVLVERSRGVLNTQPSVEVPSMLRVYALANGSSWLLVLINYGYVDSSVASLILSDGSSVRLDIYIPARSARTLEISVSSRPLYIASNSSSGVVSVEVVG
jgi:hypothetical protein